MKHDKHYGTVSYWFDDRKIGAIRSDENRGRHVMLTAEQLAGDYKFPKAGDEVCYGLGVDAKSRPLALAVERLKPPPEGKRVRLVLEYWDFQRNGGYGFYGDDRPVQVFILGPSLRDQRRVPEDGSMLEGLLLQHGNGQWILDDVVSVDHLDVEQLSDSPHSADITKNIVTTGLEAEAEEDYRVSWDDEPQVKQESSIPINTLLEGRVVYWDKSRDYGFIQYGNERVLFYLSACQDGKQPFEGAVVNFLCRPFGEEESKRAVKVVLKDEYAHLSPSISSTETGKKYLVPRKYKISLYIFFILVYVAFLTYCFWPLALWYAVWSIVAWLMYRHDKQRALAFGAYRGFAGRIPESTLLAVGLIGGWPGALLGRFFWRHKTTKQPFVACFWITVLINILVTSLLVWSGILDWLSHLLTVEFGSNGLS
ncbi:DUF1294 domain-containing protein [Neisseria sp. S1]|uniref:DUF1294 domain-containing protein n=1 Tax=Neisseria sp. S1 TaxID=3318354 RepID=UPI003A8A8404